MSKVRVDILLVERGLADSRSQAQRLIMAGQVRAHDQIVNKPSVMVATDINLTIDEGPAYVSHGSEKLAAALETFRIQVADKVCADLGASTGGFTDCLLKNGAKKVYAIDVGQGILHWNLRQDERVVVMEGTNARYLNELPQSIELVTIDASFISIKILLPVVKNWFAPDGGEVMALIKPQFEAGRKETSHGKGVIRDPEVHRQVMEAILTYAQEESYGIEGVARSPLVGPKGNVEFLAHLTYPGQTKQEISSLIDEVIEKKDK